MFYKRFFSNWAVPAFALVLLPGAAAALDSSSVLKRASVAMGSTELKTLAYSADGWGYTFGQAFVPSAHWPKIQIRSMERSINYDTASLRELITFNRAEPTGGGGYPLVAPQTEDRNVSGGYAWNVAGGNSAGAPRAIVDRIHELWITPHGVLKAAIKNNATLDFKTVGGRSLAAVSFTEAGRFKATAYLNDDYLVERVESRYPDAVMGETNVVTTYSGYRDFNGVKFPSLIQQKSDGRFTLDITVTKVEPNAAVAIAIPDAARNYAERVTTDKIADGVWFVGGGSHNSVAIEMKDHIVLVESPLGDFRVGPVVEAVKKLVPGKPIRYSVNSHHHFDHSGGLRSIAAEGATIVTQAKNKAYTEKNLATKSAINPDMLAKSGKKGKVMGVGEKGQLTDGKRVIELHHMKGSIHTDSFLMVYLPAEKLLIEADEYTPGPPNAKPPAQPDPRNVNLVNNIERLKLSVDRILPLHGRVVPVSELYAAIGKTAPR